ncbi:MAG TPA: hypothetical protein VEB40_15350, partial [Flavipsychrobacter sp.]|nr:hypothetical protein [Flavipsychrobacter sp.]
MLYTLALQPMLSYGDAFYRLKNELLPVYDEGESAAIAHELLSHITGLRKIDRLMKKDDPLSEAQVAAFEKGRN